MSQPQANPIRHFYNELPSTSFPIPNSTLSTLLILHVSCMLLIQLKLFGALGTIGNCTLVSYCLVGIQANHCSELCIPKCPISIPNGQSNLF